MSSQSKKLLVVLCAVAVLAAGLIGGSAAAQSPGGNPLEQVLSLLQDPNFGLAEIKSEVRSIEEGSSRWSSSSSWLRRTSPRSRPRWKVSQSLRN
jgi:hypothetical protein